MRGYAGARLVCTESGLMLRLKRSLDTIADRVFLKNKETIRVQHAYMQSVMNQ